MGALRNMNRRLGSPASGLASMNVIGDVSWCPLYPRGVSTIIG